MLTHFRRHPDRIHSCLALTIKKKGTQTSGLPFKLARVLSTSLDALLFPTTSVLTTQTGYTGWLAAEGAKKHPEFKLKDVISGSIESTRTAPSPAADASPSSSENAFVLSDDVISVSQASTVLAPSQPSYASPSSSETEFVSRDDVISVSQATTVLARPIATTVSC